MKQQKYIDEILISSPLQVEPLGKFQPSFAESILWWREFKMTFSSQNGDNDLFSLKQYNDILANMFIDWTVSLVSDVAHGHLVLIFNIIAVRKLVY